MCRAISLWIAGLLAWIASDSSCLVKSFAPCRVSFRVLQPSVEKLVRSSSSRGEPLYATRTLYDILGASPNDSQQQLKSKYTALARRMHPDATVGKEAAGLTHERNFSEINAAWRVLSDPKERLRYDRSLTAKEFTASMEYLFDEGIRHAIPFLKKTANSTVAAVETSSNALQEASQRMENAKARLEIDSKIRDLERQATKDKTRAAQLKTQLKSMSDMTLAALDTPDAQLSSTEARRILQGFDIEDVRPADGDIEALQDVETEYNEKMSKRQDMAKALRTALQTTKDAVSAEKLAVKKLEEAKAALLEAQSSVVSSKRAEREVMSREKLATRDVEKLSAMVKSRQEKVRTALRRKQDESMKRESIFLKDESTRLLKEAAEMQSRADKLKNE